MNPKRKLLSAMSTRKEVGHNSYGNNVTQNFSTRPTTGFPQKLRPLTGMTDLATFQKKNNTNPNSGFNFRPNSTNLAFNSNMSKIHQTQGNFLKDSNNQIEDQEKINSIYFFNEV